MDREGLVARVILCNGHVLQGTVRKWSKEEGFLLVTPRGEVVELIDPYKNVCALVYIQMSDGAFLKEHPEHGHKPGNAEHAVRMAKAAHDSDVAEIRSVMAMQACSKDNVEYAGQLPAVRNLSDIPAKI